MIAKKTLDPDTLKYLEELLNKSSKDLDADEIAFLIARKEYLTEREIDSIPKIEEVEYVVNKKKLAKYGDGAVDADDVLEPKKKAKRKYLK
jgi:hypothetical protein